MFAIKSMFGAGSNSGGGVTYDPYWDNVIMLLTGTGTNGAQNNTFTFTAGGSGSITRSGTPTIGQFAPYSTAGWYSMQFNGGTSTSNLDYLSMPSTASYAIGGSSDFTIECWVYVNQFSSGFFPVWQTDVSLVGSSGTMWFGASPTGIQIGKHGGGNPAIDFNGQTVNTGVWYHIAVARQSGTTRAFLNGKLIGTSATFNGVSFSQNGAILGFRITPNYAFGNISNFRLVNGSALYTADFTPSTTPLTNVTNTAILVTNTNAGVLDSAGKSCFLTVGSAQISSSAAKYGSTSISFPSSGSYLTTLSTQTGASYQPTPTMGSVLTGDFTIEMWVNFTSGQTSGVRTLMAQWSQVSSATAGWILRSNAGTFEFYFAPHTQAAATVSGGSVSAGNWQHIAVTRSGTTVRLFVNGTVVSTNSSVTAYGSPLTVPYSFGNYYSASNTLPATGPVDFIGYIDDARITGGYARYTANFSIPAPMPTNGPSVSPATGTISATGGDIWFRGNYKYHIFKSSGSLVVSDLTGTTDLEVLAIGGGGGGSGGGTNVGGGGGGAGGRLLSSQAITVSETLTVTVGTAGSGGGTNATGTAGGNTSISGTNFSAITATGGGRGGTNSNAGNGGSGGGVSAAFQNNGVTPSVAGTGTVGQGNNGAIGTGNYGFTSCTGGGGGGAGAAATNGSTVGGAGASSAFIVNMPGWYSIGGNGGSSAAGAASAKIANSGFGGDAGGGGGAGASGAAGGTGYLVVRYKYV